MQVQFPIMLVFTWCVAIAWSDWQSRRIPNSLVAAGLTVAVLGLVFQGQTLFGSSPLLSLTGAAGGLLLMLPLYATRVMAAGDVKLFAAIGALFGFWGLLPVWLISSLFAGAHALVWITMQRLLPQYAATPALGVFGRLPYGVHLAGGIACVALQPDLVTALTPPGWG
ncbi:MAG: prepilin peptidase [Pseudomonadota bacterium]